MRLKLYNWDIVTAEVPDEITLAINLADCPNNCEGCHSPHLREDIGEELTYSFIEKLLLSLGDTITCVCFLGGDRFPEDVAWLAHCIKIDTNLKTAWYSGNDKLPEGEVLNSFDYIKVGHFDKNCGPLNSNSTNQKFYKNNKGELEDITFKFWK